MRDYVKSRPAKVGEKLRTQQFHPGTVGFAAPEDANTAVCVLSGTELAFATAIRCSPRGLFAWKVILVERFQNSNHMGSPKGPHFAVASPNTATDQNHGIDRLVNHTTATFLQVNKDNPRTHDDALEFPDGRMVLLTHLLEGQEATVLQLPAQPVTTAETKAQKRIRKVR
jgi:hypothetical protein